MKHTNGYEVDYSTAFLSTLDISGLLVFTSVEDTANGIYYDMYQLKNDLKILENDYLIATEKVSRMNEELSNGQPKN